MTETQPVLVIPNTHAIAIVPADRQAWLEARAQDVTASDIGSLFNISPYKSKLELWIEKKSKETVALEDNSRMFWGRKLERAIAEGICEEKGWQLLDLPVTYFRDPRYNMGATPDFFVVNEHGVLGLLQIKNVDFLVFKQKWTPASEDGEAPDYIEAQLQHELAVVGLPWGAIGALVAGNQHHTYIRQAFEDVATRMRNECQLFFQSIVADVQPEMDFERDAEFIISLNSFVSDGSVLDASDDEELAKLVEEFNAQRIAEKTAGEAKDAMKARIFVHCGDAEKVILAAGQKLNLKPTKDSPGTLITADKVGTYVGGRRGYRQCKLGQE